MSAPEPIGEIRYAGEMRVRPYRHGAYLGESYLEELIERSLGPRYSFGGGWRGYAIVSIALYDRAPGEEDHADD